MPKYFFGLLVFLITSCTINKNSLLVIPNSGMGVKKIKLGTHFLNFQYYEHTKYVIGQVEHGDFHRNKNEVEFVTPIYNLISTKKNDSTNLSVRIYSEDEFVYCTENLFLNKEHLYRNCKLQLDDDNTALKNALRLVKSFEIEGHEYLIEFFLYPLDNDYLINKSRFDYADLFVESYID